MTLADIEDSPVKLNGILLKSCFDNVNGIVSKLIAHYKN